MKDYEGTLWQKIFTVPLSFIGFLLLVWIALIVGLGYLFFTV